MIDSLTTREIGYYWIQPAGCEAEEAYWTGDEWLVAGTMTRYVGPIAVLSACAVGSTRPVPTDREVAVETHEAA